MRLPNVRKRHHVHYAVDVCLICHVTPVPPDSDCEGAAARTHERTTVVAKLLKEYAEKAQRLAGADD